MTDFNRRLPIVFAMHKFIHQIEEKRQAIFVGFFGPIGVSAIFYLYITLEFLEEITVDGVVREDAARLGEVVTVVVWFLAICSIVSYLTSHCILPSLYIQVVHGLSIPLGKLGFFLPRTLSRAFSSQQNDEPDAFPVGSQVRSSSIGGILRERRRSKQSTPTGSRPSSRRRVFKIGGSVINNGTTTGTTSGVATPRVVDMDSVRPSTPPLPSRTIRFPDESLSQGDKSGEITPPDKSGEVTPPA